MTNSFHYLKPISWEQAIEALVSGGSNAIAKGAGVDLWDLLKEGIQRPERVVSLLEIPGAQTIVKTSSSIVIGATATLGAISTHPDVMHNAAALAQAADSAASPAIRNAATIAGNLCQRPRCIYFRSALHPCLRKGGGRCFAQDGDHRNHAIFDNDGCIAVSASSLGVPLVALGASVNLRGPNGATRNIPIDSLFLRASQNPIREVDLRTSELIESIVIPLSGAHNHYHKVRAREGFDWPLVEVAAAIQTNSSGAVTHARIVMGAVAMVPWRATDSEKSLINHSLNSATIRKAADAAVFGAQPLRDNGHKVIIARKMVQRTLEEVAKQTSSTP